MKKLKATKMRKLKIKKSIVKRFKVTKTGKVLHRSQNIRHKNTHKTNNQLKKIKCCWGYD